MRQALLQSADQGAGDALPPHLRRNRQMMDPAAPAVPSPHNHTDDLLVEHSHEEQFAVSLAPPGDLSATVGGVQLDARRPDRHSANTAS